MKKKHFAIFRRQAEPATNASLITQIFVRLFLIFTIVSIVVISSVTSFSALQSRESQGAYLLRSVQEAAQNGNINWREFEIAHETEGNYADYIQVTRPNGLRDQSHGTDNFLARPRQYFDHFSLNGEGLFWHTSSTKKGIKAELWLNLNTVLNTLFRTIITIIVVMLGMFVLGIIFIRRYAHRLSNSLVELAQAADANQDQTNPLPEPAQPLEVQQLASSFNRLLTRLASKIEQEQQFVSDASHELRTPVAAISGHVNLLKRHYETHPEIISESLTYIDEETERMKTMVEELLMISRGNNRLTFEDISLADFATHVAAEIGPALSQQISVEAEQDYVVKADRTSLHHILIAFLENAGKYSPADSLIRLRLTADDEQIDLAVIDEGAGIPDEAKNKIFERFYRLDKSRASSTPGTGLGLAIAKQYAELNHASVSVTDNQPQGSQFHLIFPKKGEIND